MVHAALPSLAGGDAPPGTSSADVPTERRAVPCCYHRPTTMPNVKKQPPAKRRTATEISPPTQDKLAVEVGTRLVEAREGLGLSQQAVAVRSKMADPGGEGISRSTLSLYETGVNKPGAREIMILCETLKITPNWVLYGADHPAKTLQASLDFLRGSELDAAPRLAFAILALDPEERDSFASLIFASLNKKLGDVRFASLLMMATLLRESLLKEILDTVGEDRKDLPIRELIAIFVKKSAGDVVTNVGTLRPPLSQDQLDAAGPVKPPPLRKLRQK